YHYQHEEDQKGKGRYGPFHKCNDMINNVNKKYDFNNLCEKDIVERIEHKKKKEREKIVHNWEEEGIRVEKARWKRHKIIKGKTKIELPKEVDAKALTLDEVKKIIAQHKPSKKRKKKESKTSNTKPQHK